MYVNATSIPCFEHKHEHVVGFPICSHGNSRKFLCGARPGRSLVELKNNYTYTPTYTFLVFPNDSEIALMTHLMAEFRKRTCLDWNFSIPSLSNFVIVQRHRWLRDWIYKGLPTYRDRQIDIQIFISLASSRLFNISNAYRRNKSSYDRTINFTILSVKTSFFFKILLAFNFKVNFIATVRVNCQLKIMNIATIKSLSLLFGRKKRFIDQ